MSVSTYPRWFRLGALKICLATLCALGLRGEDVGPIDWNLEALRRPPAVSEPPADIETPEGMRALMFEGPVWRGKPTKVFAYYGIPAGASPEHKVPGIVLVHGAGGIAFADWVKLWVKRGYAAIAFDNEGQLPVGKYNAWTRNPEGGPRRDDIVQLDWAPTNQWMYHAVADTVLAHSLLASLPGVDADRIGATGISWGAVVLSNVAGIDTRLKFAVPVYGCGYISDESDDGSTFVGRKSPTEKREAWRRLWDPANFLPAARCPMLWVTGTNDFAFTMKSWQQSYRAAPGTRSLCLRVRMTHAHGGPGESPEEIHAFADSIVLGGKPLARMLNPGRERSRVWVDYESPVPVRHAKLNFTRDTGRWQDRVWETIPARLEGGRILADLPDDATVYYFNLTDDRDLVVSSGHLEVEP